MRARIALSFRGIPLQSFCQNPKQCRLLAEPRLDHSGIGRDLAGQDADVDVRAVFAGAAVATFNGGPGAHPPGPKQATTDPAKSLILRGTALFLISRPRVRILQPTPTKSISYI